MRGLELRPLDLAVAALAGYRGARLIVDDDLPQMEWLREKVLARWPDEERAEENAEQGITPDRPHWVGSLITCPYCAGFWTTLLAVAGWRWGGPLVRFGVGVFAAAGGQALLSQAEKALTPDSWQTA